MSSDLAPRGGEPQPRSRPVEPPARRAPPGVIAAARQLLSERVPRSDPPGAQPEAETDRAERASPIGKWDYHQAEQFAFGDDTTYRTGIAFLDGHGPIEDWGCGTAYARRFVTRSAYTGLDGSASRFSDKTVDLRTYRSETACLFMRHVLEHNHEWQSILANAIESFRNRMVLIIFTPFGEQTRQISSSFGIPDIAFRKEDLTKLFDHLQYREESLVTATLYGFECIFYIERRSDS